MILFSSPEQTRHLNHVCMFSLTLDKWWKKTYQTSHTTSDAVVRAAAIAAVVKLLVLIKRAWLMCKFWPHTNQCMNKKKTTIIIQYKSKGVFKLKYIHSQWVCKIKKGKTTNLLQIAQTEVNIPYAHTLQPKHHPDLHSLTYHYR